MSAPGRVAALKLLGRETNESVMLFEETVPAGTKSLFHLHHDSDEVAWVLAGEITFKIGDDVTVGGPGTCVYPDSQHTDECYFNSPTFDIDALQAFTAQHLGDALMPLDEVTTRTNNIVSDFTLKEQVWAGYLMANLKLGDAVTVTPGLRYEHTRLNVAGFQLQNASLPSFSVIPASARNEYEDWLPSLVVRPTAPPPSAAVPDPGPLSFFSPAGPWYDCQFRPVSSIHSQPFDP